MRALHSAPLDHARFLRKSCTVVTSPNHPTALRGSIALSAHVGRWNRPTDLLSQTWCLRLLTIACVGWSRKHQAGRNGAILQLYLDTHMLDRLGSSRWYLLTTMKWHCRTMTSFRPCFTSFRSVWSLGWVVVFPTSCINCLCERVISMDESENKIYLYMYLSMSCIDLSIVCRRRNIIHRISEYLPNCRF